MHDFEPQLHRILAQAVPDFIALDACARLSGGASQETYTLDLSTHSGARRLVLRRGPGGVSISRKYGGPGLTVEARLMELAGTAGVPVPAIVHVCTADDGLGEAFIMEWLDGETLGARIVRAPELAAVRPRLAYQCGQILARIHAIELERSGLTAVLEHLTPRAFVERQWQYYRAFSTPQPMIDFTARWLLEHLPPAVPPTLVHNDFRNGNLMITAAAGVVGVLDWEIAHIGDPMRDLGWICTNSWRFGHSSLAVGGFGTRADLFAGYADASGRTVDPEHVKFWEVSGSFWWAIGCLAMAEHFRSGPDRTVERPAIGRRSSECQIDCVNLIIPGHVLPPVAAGPPSSELPRTDELLSSVRDFLRNDVMPQTSGRTQFMARVAGNSLDIVLRELAFGPTLAAAEQARLRTLLGHDGAREDLRWELVQRLRDGSMALATGGLAEHLRATVFGQVAIDQPQYSGYNHAVAGTVP